MQRILSCALPCPWNRFISVWELLKVSFENYRTYCKEKRQDIKQITKHHNLSIKESMFSAVKTRYEATYLVGGAEEF